MRIHRPSLLAPLVLALAMGAALGQSAADLSRFDGLYDGAFETTQASGRGCGAGHTHQMTIKDGRISMTFNTMKRFAGTIDARGAIVAAGGDTRLTGALAADVVSGQAWNGDCAYRFSLKRRG
jgi:hypothetical protein